jgi:hypothetical protein
MNKVEISFEELSKEKQEQIRRLVRSNLISNKIIEFQGCEEKAITKLMNSYKANLLEEDVEKYIKKICSNDINMFFF